MTVEASVLSRPVSAFIAPVASNNWLISAAT
jgi:hypothetical protein